MNNTFDTAYLTGDQMEKIRVVLDELKRNVRIFEIAKYLQEKKGNLEDTSWIEVDEKLGSIEEYEQYADTISDEDLNKFRFYLEILNEIYQIEKNHREKMHSIMSDKQRPNEARVLMSKELYSKPKEVSYNTAIKRQVNYENKIYIHQKKHGYAVCVGSPFINESAKKVKKIRKITKNNFQTFIDNLNEYYCRALDEEPVKLDFLSDVINQVSYTKSRRI